MPRASKGYWLPSITCLPDGWAGGVKVEADRNIVAVGRPHIGSQVLTYNGFTDGSLSAYVPMLFKNAYGGSYNAALYVQNVAAVPATVIITFYDSLGNETYALTDNINPLASKGYWLPAIAELGTSWVGGVRIVSDQEIVAIGRPHIGDQVMTYNGFPEGSADAYVPMLFKNAWGGYDAALYIQNLDTNSDASLTIRYYDNSGVETCSQTDTLAPLASKGYWVPSVGCLPDGWVGGARIESNVDIVAVGRPHIGTQVTTYNAFLGGSMDANVPMLFRDAFGGSYDSALYIQNVDPLHEANVTLRFYNADGNLSCIKTDTLPALAITGYWLPSLTCDP